MRKKLIFIVLIVGLVFGMASVYESGAARTAWAAPAAGAAGDEQSVTILFTHDMHSHLLPVKGLGGFARLKTAIDEEKKLEPDALLLDAGDFSMGTLFQTLYSKEAPELRLLGRMGYEAATFGNHEFDFRGQGLADMLQAAVKSGDPLPAITASNIDWPENPDGTVASMKAAMDGYGVAEYLVFEKGGVKIAVFGLMGYDAIESAPMSGVGFRDFIEQAEATVAKIKSKEAPDLILCLSHSGTWDDPEISEDELLAKAVPDIDVIISGHTHTLLPEPLMAENTAIVSCGEYSRHLGVLKLARTSEGPWSVEEYRLKPIDSSLKEDHEIAKEVGAFREMVENGYLSPYGLGYDQVIAKSPFPFTPFKDFAKDHREDALGNLIADSYIYAVKQAEGKNYETIAASVVPAGVIRESIEKGPITAADVFSISSLGIGRDGTVGYPLISVYLTGKELKGVAEVDASVTPIMSSAQLYISGLSYTFNPHRLSFNKVTDVSLVLPDGTASMLSDHELYRVVCGLYSGQMLGAVKGKTMGMIGLEPKDRDGNLIEDFEDHIIRDEAGEVKEWLALASYLQSFPPDEDGIPAIPLYYSQAQGRKLVEDSTALGDLLGSPNHVFFILLGAILVLIALIAVLSLLIRKLVRKRKRRTV